MGHRYVHGGYYSCTCMVCSQGVEGRIPPNATLIIEVEVNRVKFSKEQEEVQVSAAPQ